MEGQLFPFFIILCSLYIVIKRIENSMLPRNGYLYLRRGLMVSVNLCFSLVMIYLHGDKR